VLLLPPPPLSLDGCSLAAGCPAAAIALWQALLLQ
jgi:hypothetical protein